MVGARAVPVSLRPMDIPEIDVAELARQREAGAPLIDVREDDEFATARVPGAHHIPLAEVPERIDEVPSAGTVYVICAKGARSARAAEHYRRHGIDAVNVAGGTLEWIDAGLPTESGAGDAGA
jgi:rhodanese-related sulfurtransferase